VVSILFAGCSKDPAQAASDSDANGYLCLKCDNKFWTSRSVFMGPACPKCKEDTLMEVVGYRCAKDQYTTIRPHRGGVQEPLSCPKCNAALQNAMFLPRQKDLIAWGAVNFKP
jgi:DNA-directed RNA polymerase subunit RPC12/RpoP